MRPRAQLPDLGGPRLDQESSSRYALPLMQRLALALGLCATASRAQVSVHYQGTVATQVHPSFAAAYSGDRSMRPGAESATSVILDLFLAAHPWPGGEIYLQPELSGGLGLSQTLGVAAFPSGEVYRVGKAEPTPYVARAFVRQTLGLGGGRERVGEAPGQIALERDRNRLTLIAGKLSTPDLFDANPVSSDPHTRFESWGLWASAAFDYPADTRGYTWGIAADLALGSWSARAGMFLEPTEANQIHLEWDLGRARSLVAETEWRFGGGAVRVLGFFNTAHMGSYEESLRLGNEPPDVTKTRADGRTKGGACASVNLALSDWLAGFARASFNDGANETWAFTEIDRSLALGMVASGDRWARPGDEAGAALVISGLSDPHRRYLRAAGLGFLIGDGALRYGPEVLGELFYRVALSREISAIGHYQPIVNPAFNRDRGPIHVFTAALHVAL